MTATSAMTYVIAAHHAVVVDADAACTAFDCLEDRPNVPGMTGRFRMRTGCLAAKKIVKIAALLRYAAQ